MTPGLLEELSRYPAFPASAKVLIQLVGVDVTAKLIGAWPGQDVPMPAVVGGGNDAGRRLWHALSELIGTGAAEILVRHFGGEDMLVPNLRIVFTQRQREVIRREFDAMVADGASGRVAVFELGVRHGLSRKSIELVLKQESTGIEPKAPLSISTRPRKPRLQGGVDMAQGSLF